MANSDTGIQNSIKRYEDILKKSRTAYNPGSKPTSSDISAQIGMMKAKNQLESSQGETAKQRWYGEESDDRLKQDKGYLGKVLHGLGAPLYAVTGAIESVLGKGTKKGMLENIAANVEEEGTMGDLVRSYGVNNFAAMPLGLALDIALDPVNWATMGTGALVPRLFKGASKAGLAGVESAAKSNLLGKAKTLGKIAGLSKETPEGLQVSRWKNLYNQVAKGADEAATDYERLTGDTVEKALSESITKKRFFERVGSNLEKSDFGRAINKIFAYSPSKWFKTKVAEETISAANKVDEPIGKSIRETVPLLTKSQTARALDAKDVSVRMAIEREQLDDIQRNLNDELNNIRKLVSDPKALDKISGMSQKELNEMTSLFRYYKSEYDAYDKTLAKTLLSPTARKLLTSYGLFTGLFKNAKIGGNLLVSGTNSVVGNAVMTGMIGINVANRSFYNSMSKAIGIVKGKEAKALQSLIGNENWMEAMKKYPDIFEEIYGMKPDLLINGRQYIDDVVSQLTSAKGFKRDIADLDEIRRVYDDAFRVVQLSSEGRETSFLSAEILRGPYQDFLNKIKAMGESGNKAADLFYKFSTKPIEAYNKIDQTYRLGLSLHLTNSGISGQELRMLAKRLPIGMADVEKAGENLYKIKPLKAMEIAQETYLNYLAMPAFVKIMRTLPLVGSPFLSFAYGMTANAAKTGIYNTSFFNKIQFLLKEITGQKSPLEKDALEGPYYNWLDRPGMVKLPFFDENPVYLNMANMLPYYTMSLLAPSQREYKDKYGGAIANVIDRSPFFKTPDGQIMLDYVFLPWMLQNESPQSSFGTPLYPKDASFGEKIHSFGLAAGETVMPPMLGFAGLATPESALPAIPNYRWRQLGYAKEGKTALGIPGKEPALERTSRVMSAMAGWPIYSVKLNLSTGETKKKAKKK